MADHGAKATRSWMRRGMCFGIFGFIVPIALFPLVTPDGDIALADSKVTQRSIEVEHVRIESAKSFAEVDAALEAAVPALDPRIVEALAHGDGKRAAELAHGTPLFIF